MVELHRPVDIADGKYDCAYIELGCPGIPHAVLTFSGWAARDRDELRELGRKLRYAPEFPKGQM